jgi:hypothetical protein
MADAYGVFIFSKSSDCNINAAKLVEKLNAYQWAFDDAEWCLDPDDMNEIYCDTHHPKYPTVHPLKTLRTQVQLEDGTEVWIDGVPEFFDDDNIVDVETAEVDLDNLCADISQAIDSGWIEIGLSANMKQRYTYYQTLQIYYNGQGVRTHALTGYEFPQGVTTEFTKLFQSS